MPAPVEGIPEGGESPALPKQIPLGASSGRRSCSWKAVRPPVEFGDLKIDAACATISDKVLPLRRRQLEVLYELAAVRGRILSRQDLEARIWRGPMKSRTVDATICQLRSVLKNTSLRIETERELGYRLVHKPANAKRVLVVDVETVMQRAYRRFFRQLAVDCEIADSRYSAERLVQAHDYGAYLLDLNLPDGCGADVIPLILERDPRAAVMIVTARSDERAVALSGEHGVPYMRKPFRRDALRRFVFRAIGRGAEIDPRRARQRQ